MEHPEEREHRPDPEPASDEAVIREALRMLHELDDTPQQDDGFVPGGREMP